MTGALPAPDGRTSGSSSFVARMNEFAKERKGCLKKHDYDQESRSWTPSPSHHALPLPGVSSTDDLDARIQRLQKREKELKKEIETRKKEAKKESKRNGRERMSMDLILKGHTGRNMVRSWRIIEQERWKCNGIVTNFVLLSRLCQGKYARGRRAS